MSSMPHHRQQSGFSLFMGIIVLLLITILVAAAMNVSVLQERMSGGYRQSATAFQNAETAARDEERRIRTAQESNSDPTVTTAECTGFDAEAWAKTQTGKTSHSQRIDLCEGSTSLAMGRSATMEVDRKFKITSTDGTGTIARGSRSIVETVFIP